MAYLNGLAINIFGGSHLLVVLMPEEGEPDYCEFKRIVSNEEQVLSDDGWQSPIDAKLRRFFKDQSATSRYFVYFLDDCSGQGAQYLFRVHMNGIFSPWRPLETQHKNILPAPRNVKALRTHANRE